MSLGTLAACLGMALWVGSPSGAVMGVAVSALLLSYVKLMRERELEARFGAEYSEYRRTTPFLIPRLPRVTGGSGAEASADGRE